MSGPRILSFYETPYDTIQFRIIPFNDANTGEQKYTLVEEKVKDGRIAADQRRVLNGQQFQSLANAVDSASD